MTLSDLHQKLSDLPDSEIFPTLFVGHGSPMNAIEQNSYVSGWKTIGEHVPRPNAILAISAHWLTEGTKVHVAREPKTIHDFYGFPKELYEMTYPCPGSPRFAEATQQLLLPTPVAPDQEWGIDHGTWVVLQRMFPKADIPVFQMSIDVGRIHQAHYELGKLLAPLRKKGVLIIGSGNLVHNLGRIAWEEGAKPFDWAQSFDEKASKLLTDRNHDALINYEKLGEDASLSIPTPDHYWPLLYTLGLQEVDEMISFPVTGIAHGSISMRTVLIG